MYATVKLWVDVNEGELTTHAIERIATDADYSFEHEDDICRIAETELLDVSDEVPSHLQ